MRQSIFVLYYFDWINKSINYTSADLSSKRVVFAEESADNAKFSKKFIKTGVVEETVEIIGVLSTGLSTKASKTGLVEETVENICVSSTTSSTMLDCTISITTIRK